ncbi:MAG: sodium:calcium antiporter, partial [Candidatus Asgardarchaeum californiense]
ILVTGTSKTAAHLGISALIISVILVGFGTSAPEFAISGSAAIQKNADISLGNIIGSCVANILLVLGVGAVISPLSAKKSIIKREAPIMLGATVLLLMFSILGLLDKYHLIGGIIFLVLFTVFVLYFIRAAKKERIDVRKVDEGKTRKNILFIILGIAGVVIGAQLLIESSVTIANYFKISPFVIAISMVAVGTSLPELVVSATASYKNEDDIAIGNVLGSNVFNILLILGFSALFIPLGAGVAESLSYIWILLGVSLVLFPILYTGHKISRLEGVGMIILYLIFMWYIFIGKTLFV